jgi:hypothetical protein
MARKIISNLGVRYEIFSFIVFSFHSNQHTMVVSTQTLTHTHTHFYLFSIHSIVLASLAFLMPFDHPNIRLPPHFNVKKRRNLNI